MEFVKLHDEALDHEHDILQDVEMLAELREKLHFRRRTEWNGLKIVEKLYFI